MLLRRTAALGATLVALAGCTSGSSTPTRSEGRSVAPSSPAAAGLRVVKDYGQEFCSGGAVPLHCPNGAVPEALRRPLKIPSIEASTACPVSEPNPEIWSRAAPALGPGPLGPVGLGSHATLRFRPFAGSEWGGQKVLWVAVPGYDGPALIRGGRVDGYGGVGFNVNGSGPPFAELQLPPGNEPERINRGGYREWPSYTRVRLPGCYAYQVDGTNFSYVIVFRAEPLR